jgi:hypothetical protein
MKTSPFYKLAIPSVALILIALYLGMAPAVFEPGTYALAGIGAIGFMAGRRRQR